VLWGKLRPWLGFSVFVVEMLLPVAGYEVQPLIVAGAIAMMGIEALMRSGHPDVKNGEGKP
jgi:hypothetical protein